MTSERTDSISFLFIKAAKAYRNLIQNELSKIGLYAGQEVLLFQLWETEGLSQSELADRLDVEPAAISKMLNRMESAGLVERRTDPTDSRVSQVFLTDDGRSLQEPVEDIWDHAETQLLEGLSTEEKLLFRRMLVDIRDNLSESNQSTRQE